MLGRSIRVEAVEVACHLSTPSYIIYSRCFGFIVIVRNAQTEGPKAAHLSKRSLLAPGRCSPSSCYASSSFPTPISMLPPFCVHFVPLAIALALVSGIYRYRHLKRSTTGKAPDRAVSHVPTPNDHAKKSIYHANRGKCTPPSLLYYLRPRH